LVLGYPQDAIASIPTIDAYTSRPVPPVTKIGDATYCSSRLLRAALRRDLV
jgi:hypothetical protein